MSEIVGCALIMENVNWTMSATVSMAPATVELAPGDHARAAESLELPVASNSPAETLEKFLISSSKLPVVEL